MQHLDLVSQHDDLDLLLELAEPASSEHLYGSTDQGEEECECHGSNADRGQVHSFKR